MEFRCLQGHEADNRTDRAFFSFAVICGFLALPEGTVFCDFAAGPLEPAGLRADTGGGVGEFGGGALGIA